MYSRIPLRLCVFVSPRCFFGLCFCQFSFLLSFGGLLSFLLFILIVVIFMVCLRLRVRRRLRQFPLRRGRYRLRCRLLHRRRLRGLSHIFVVFLSLGGLL